MLLTCDYCGMEFARPASAEKRLRDGSPQTHHYCSRSCATRGARRGRDLTVIHWLSAAEKEDELYLVNRILRTALDMRKHEIGSPEWERLDAKHSCLLDVTRDIFTMRGKRAPDNVNPNYGCF